MEEQQQAEEQQQQQHRGAGGSDGWGGAGAAAQGPHHGGRLTRNGAPPAGNPSHPRRGVAATTSTVATPASSLASAPSQEIQGGRGRCVDRKKGRGAAKAGWRTAPPATGVECGGVRPGRRRQAGGEARSRGGASLRDAARRKQSSAWWGPAGGCRAQAPGDGGAVLPEPTPPSPASLPAARSAPGSERGGLQERAEPGEGPRGSGGFLQTRSSPDDSRGGKGGGGERARRGQASRSPPPGTAKSGRSRGARSREAAGERGEQLQVPRRPMPSSSSAGQLLTSSHPLEGSREGGGGSAHAARSFRRRRCPNRGRPQKEAK